LINKVLIIGKNGILGGLELKMCRNFTDWKVLWIDESFLCSPTILSYYYYYYYYLSGHVSQINVMVCHAIFSTL